MDLLNIPTFSDEIRLRAGPVTREIMDKIPQAALHAAKFSSIFGNKFELRGTTDLRAAHNQCVDAILASMMLKNALLNRAMIESVNRYDFLAYALAGRALIETTATIRFYLGKKIFPLIQRCVQKGAYTSDELRQLIDHEHRFLTGSRFDWPKFFQAGFDALAHDYSDWLRRKRKDRQAKKWTADPLFQEQINVATCLEDWARDEPRLGVLYDLFCDMVHPNIGSTLCIASHVEDGITFTADTRQSYGFHLFDLSYAPLQTIAGKEFASVLATVPLLKIVDNV